MGICHLSSFMIRSRRYKGILGDNLVLFHRPFSAVQESETITGEDNFWDGKRISDISYLQEVLQKCARLGASVNGKACHALLIQFGLQTDVLTSNMLINAYSKCGLLDSARKVFERMPERSLVSWNTIIGSLGRNGEAQAALDLFLLMQREGSSFSEFTISSILCACAAKCALVECEQLHAFAIKAKLETNVFVATALLDVYAKCGLIMNAKCVFEGMPERSVVTWSSMVAGYVQNELYEEALMLFHTAQVSGLKQDQYMISSAVCACAGLAALIEGNQVFAVLTKSGFASNMFVAASLIDMNSKCGCITEAYNVFRCMEETSIVVWNAMISGLARNGHSLEAMILFEKMQQLGLQPNEVTYISILSACCHMGLVREGQSHFDQMKTLHQLSPNVLHYACMVDILGRAGLVHEAYDVIKKLPFDPTASMWGSLLASCRIHRNLELADVAGLQLFEKEPQNAGNYVLLSYVYAANEKWDEVSKARKLLKENEVKKEKGRSWIEIKDKVHSFIVGDRDHPKIAEIYSRLDDLMEELKKVGYRAETQHDLHCVEESKKQELLRHHSEKLALTFGLMSLPCNAPIRIMKNLRICGDCHNFMKLVSSHTGRTIIVRDNNRFHHFKNGHCSCGNFW